MPVDLNSCNINTLNNLDDQIISVCEEASKVNGEDISESTKTHDANTQPDTQLSFNHDIIINNLNAETILNQFKELIVKTQVLQASHCKFINDVSPNNLTKLFFFRYY